MKSTRHQINNLGGLLKALLFFGIFNGELSSPLKNVMEKKWGH